MSGTQAPECGKRVSCFYRGRLPKRSLLVRWPWLFDRGHPQIRGSNAQVGPYAGWWEPQASYQSSASGQELWSQ